MKEDWRRSLVKAILYRFLGTLATLIVAFIFTQRIEISLAVAIVDSFAKIVMYFIYERLWNCVGWGKESNFKKN